MAVMEQAIYDDHYVLPEAAYTQNKDFTRLVRCLWVFVASCLLAGLVYIFSGNVKVAAGICGTVGILLTLYHTPFGLFILFTLFSIENAVVLSPAFTISKAMGIIVFVSFLLHLYRLKLVFPAPMRIAVVMVIWAMLSIIWAIQPWIAAFSVLSLTLDIGLMFIFLNIVKDEKSLFIIISGFICGAIVSSFLIFAGLVAELSGTHAEMGRVRLHEGTSPGILAQSFCLGFLAAFYVLFRKGLIKKILAVCLLVLFFFVLIVKTQSRMASACALGIPVIVMILCSSSRHKWKYMFVAFVLAIITLFAIRLVMHSNLLSEAAKERMRGAGLEESGRLMMWRQGFSWFLRRPIHGYGFYNFQSLSEVQWGQGGITAAHNNFVAWTVDMGLIGLVLATAFLYPLYKGIKKISDPPLKWLAFAMFLYPLLIGLTSTTYLQKDFWYSFSIVMAVINIGRIKNEDQARQQMSYHEPSRQDCFSNDDNITIIPE